MATEQPIIILIPSGLKRRNSTGNFDISTNAIIVPSRYLKASVGSCHDLCKLGLKHVPETITRNPTTKRHTSLPGVPRVPNKITNPVELEKKSVVGHHHKSLPNPKTQTRSQEKEIIKKQHFPAPAKIIDMPKQVLPPSGKVEASESEIPGKKPIVKKQDQAISKKAFVSSGNVSSKEPLNAKLSSRSTTDHSNSTRDSEVVGHNDLKAPKGSVVGDSSQRRNGNINKSKEEKTSKLNTKLSSHPATENSSSKRHNDVVVARERKTPEASAMGDSNRRKNGRISTNKEEKTSKPRKKSGRTTSPKSPLKGVWRPKSEHRENSTNVDDIPEKILYVIETEPEKPTAEQCPSSPSPIPSYENQSLGSDQTGTCSDQVSPSFVERKIRHTRNSSYPNGSSSSSHDSKSFRRGLKGTHKRSSSSISVFSSSSSLSESLKFDENSSMLSKSRPRDCKPRSLKFQRGKLVDVKPENGSARKLRFRQGRGLGENESYNSYAKRKGLRKSFAQGDFAGTKGEDVKRVLRHQAVEEKKDAQSLLNNVIEETASKLVETRKSKVKALVGAFETVISLQDSKSAVTK